MRRTCAAAVLATIASTAGAQDCLDPAMVAGWLRDQGYRMHGWGLDHGDMEELWLGPGDAWAVVRTTPAKCARVVSMPQQPGRRLDASPRNPALGPVPMGEGTAG